MEQVQPGSGDSGEVSVMKSESLSFKVLFVFPEGVAAGQPPPHDIFWIKKPKNLIGV